jgi:hypothetical protein
VIVFDENVSDTLNTGILAAGHTRTSKTDRSIDNRTYSRERIGSRFRHTGLLPPDTSNMHRARRSPYEATRRFLTGSSPGSAKCNAEQKKSTTTRKPAYFKACVASVSKLSCCLCNKHTQRGASNASPPERRRLCPYRVRCPMGAAQWSRVAVPAKTTTFTHASTRPYCENNKKHTHIFLCVRFVPCFPSTRPPRICLTGRPQRRYAPAAAPPFASNALYCVPGTKQHWEVDASVHPQSCVSVLCAPLCRFGSRYPPARVRAYPHLFIHTLVTNQGDRVRASLNFSCIRHSFFDARISCACVAVGPVVHHGRPLAKSHFSQAWSALSEPSPRVSRRGSPHTRIFA